ncbi:MAG: YjiH family protein, partial [Fusobacteriaceae bacterium]
MEELNDFKQNLNDNAVLDALVLTKDEHNKGIVKALFFTFIAIFIFFIPLTINDNTDITFGIIYKSIKVSLGIFGVWIGGLIIIINGLLSIYGKFFCKNTSSPLYLYYEEDSKLHPLFYMLGSIFTLILLLNQTFPSFNGPTYIVAPNIGGTVFSIALDVALIIPVSTLFMPFLLNYGVVDFIGSLMEPFMRPVFKVPGRSAVNAIASFVSSASVGVLITSKLYQSGVYTKKEAALIATGFSAVSVGFAYKVIETADLAEYFLPIYFIAMVISLVVSFFMARIPPLSKKESTFVNGHVQTQKEIEREVIPINAMLKTGFYRAVKKAHTAPNLIEELKSGLKDSLFILPKVISLLTSVGIIAMLIATYTPLFTWIGKLFEPLLNLLLVPNASEIAASLPVGIAEMFLPVLLIA